MRFFQNRTCSCGGQLTFETYGDNDWPTASCPSCELGACLSDPLGVSIVAERLLLRSKTELEAGDYSISIVIGVISVESFLTKLFFKSKQMDFKVYNLATPAQIEEWENEYRRRRGFPVAANFVSKAISGLPFDDFVAANSRANFILSTLKKPM